MAFDPALLKKQELTETKKEAVRKSGFDMLLPFPVSNNQIHQPGRNGGVILTSKARAYYCEICELLRDKIDASMTGRLVVDVWFFESDLRKRDINNYTKNLFDALEMAKVFVDDEQIDETHLYRGELREVAQVRVRIRELQEKPERKPIKVQKKEAAKVARENDRVKVLTRNYGKEATEGLNLFRVKPINPKE